MQEGKHIRHDVQITKSFSDVINDAKYRVQLNIAKQEQNVMSELQIKNITDIPSVEMISSSMPEETTNYGQTTIINVKNTTLPGELKVRSGQDSTGIIIGIIGGVSALIIIVVIISILTTKRHRKRRLHISGPNDERPRDSVSLDSYDDVDTNEYMNHSMENIKNTRENTDIDCSIEENDQEFIAYDQEFEFGISTGATGGNDNRHTENQTAGSPYNRIIGMRETTDLSYDIPTKIGVGITIIPYTKGKNFIDVGD
uniref:Uncharacterized protein n=1 Tax=Magallana gigas TaxID=29159 RepID=K1PWQ6_MAGGI